MGTQRPFVPMDQNRSNALWLLWRTNHKAAPGSLRNWMASDDVERLHLVDTQRRITLWF